MKTANPFLGVKKQVTFDKAHEPIFTVVKGDISDKGSDVSDEEEEGVNEMEIPLKGIYMQAWYTEIPDLTFGRKDGFTFFNASDFQQKRGTKKDIRDFFKLHTVKVYVEALGVDKLMRFSDAGDVLLYKVLAIAYVEFIDPKFSLWMHDRLHELLYNGVVASDSYLAINIKKRFSKTMLEDLIKI